MDSLHAQHDLVVLLPASVEFGTGVDLLSYTQCDRHVSFVVVIARGDTVSTLPCDGSAEQSDHANDGKDDVSFRPDQLKYSG